LNVQSVPINEIRPYWRNPRKNEAAVDSVLQSIQDYGYLQPIVVDKKNVIIVGHTRYKALQILEVEEIPVVVADLPPEKAKEYRLIDNASGEIAEWDWDKLLPEMREFSDVDRVQIHFPALDLDSILDDSPTAPGYSEASQDDIEDREHDVAETHTRRSEHAQAGYVPLVCPECGEEFAVDREDFLRRVQPTAQGDENG
jgi:hypothetical protein